MRILFPHSKFQELLLEGFERYGPAKEGEPSWMDFFLRESESEDRNVQESDLLCQFGLIAREEGVEVVFRPHFEEERKEHGQELLEQNISSISKVIETFIQQSYKK